MINLSGSIIVGYDFSESDNGVLIVGKQDKGKVKVINAFEGREAKELLDRLITKKGKEKNE